MNYSRRSLLKNAAAALVVFPLVNQNMGKAYAQVPAKPVDPASPQSQALGYYHDAKAVDVTKWPRKAGPEGAAMNCSNCQLLLTRGVTIAGQPGEWGQCALFQDGLVNALGWCNSWVQKQGA